MERVVLADPEVIRLLEENRVNPEHLRKGTYSIVCIKEDIAPGLFNRPRGVQRQAGSQTLEGSFLAVSTPILQADIRLKALDEIYKIYTLMQHSDLMFYFYFRIISQILAGFRQIF